MSDNFEDKVLEALSTLQEGQARLQEDVSTLKGDVSTLQHGQKELQGSVSTLQHGQKELQGSVRRLELLQETVEDKIDTIIEIVTPEMEKLKKVSTRLDNVEEAIDFQEKRIRLLEKSA